MATKDEVVSAITHIMNNIHSDQWRGKLNDFEYQQLKSIYEDSTAGDTPVKDTLIGSLRNQWPSLFDPKTGGEVNPRETPVVAGSPSPSTSPAGSTGPSTPEAPKSESGQGSSGGEGTDELSGKAADAAKKLDTALAKNHSDINDANGQLTDAILSAKTADAQGKGKLNSLKQSIIDEVDRIGPNAMDTRAGMEEFATFLQGKTSDIMNVIRTANLDSESQAKVMDALTARFTALGKKGGQSAKPGPDPDNPAAPGTPGEPGATPGAPGSPADPGLGPDPLLNGALPSDSLLSGLGSAIGPAAGALGSLPGMLSSAIPSMGGGSGGGLGDLGSTIGSALRDANGPAGEDGKSGELKDQHTGGDDKHGEDNKDGKDGKSPELKDQKPGADPNAQQQPGAPANGVPVAAAGTAPGPDLMVKIDGLGDIKLDNPALAMAGREVIAGGNVHDAYNRAGIAQPPPGTPVTTNAVSPGKTVFGDVGQYVDHQIMALGDNKAWVNGKVVALDQIEQGTNFLGWMHPSLPTPATPAPVLAPGPVTAAPVIAASAPAVPSVSVGAAFPGLSGP